MLPSSFRAIQVLLCPLAAFTSLVGCAAESEYVAQPASIPAVEYEASSPVVAAVPVVAAPAPDLAVVADAHARAAMPTGAPLGGAYLGVAYARKDFTDWMFPLEVGRCYAFGFAAEPTVRKVQLSLFNPQHRRVDGERGLPPQGSLRHCATQNGMYRLEARAGGAGRFAVVAYAETQGSAVGRPAAAPSPELPQPTTHVSGAAPATVVVSQAGSTVNVYTQ